MNYLVDWCLLDTKDTAKNCLTDENLCDRTPDCQFLNGLDVNADERHCGKRKTIK